MYVIMDGTRRAIAVPALSLVSRLTTTNRTEHTHARQQYLEKGGRFGTGQSAAKGCTDPIRCYG